MPAEAGSIYAFDVAGEHCLEARRQLFTVVRNFGFQFALVSVLTPPLFLAMIWNACAVLPMRAAMLVASTAAATPVKWTPSLSPPFEIGTSSPML
jgi:hypothetical protein